MYEERVEMDERIENDEGEKMKEVEIKVTYKLKDSSGSFIVANFKGAASDTDGRDMFDPESVPGFVAIYDSSIKTVVLINKDEVLQINFKFIEES